MIWLRMRRVKVSWKYLYYRNEDVSDIENAAYSDDDGLSTGKDGQSHIQILMMAFYLFTCFKSVR